MNVAVGICVGGFEIVGVGVMVGFGVFVAGICVGVIVGTGVGVAGHTTSAGAVRTLLKLKTAVLG